MRERLLDHFQLKSNNGNSIALQNRDGYTLTLAVVDTSRNLFRIRIDGQDRPIPPNTLQLPQPDSGSSQDASPIAGQQSSAAVKASDSEAKLDWLKSPVITITASDGQVIHKDLPNRAYNLSGYGIRHYSAIDRKDVHLGLGEVGAPINLTGRKFELRTSDSASYDSYSSDMLYKHTPFLIRVPAQGGLCTGYYSTSSVDSVWDLGKSLDEPWGAYKTFEVETAGLELYVFSGTLPQVCQTMAWITGGLPMMPPRWSLGYLSSSMGIAESDDPPAQILIEEFLQELVDYDIPCSGMCLSSGYTVTKTASGISRNVFTLNTERFPDFSGFCRKWHELGMRIVPNIKPYLVTTHPDYESLEKDGGFFLDPHSNEICRTYIWSLGIGETLTGSWVDTSSPAGYGWWYNGASKLIQMGVDGLWNDNDEYSLHDDTYTAAWSIPGLPEQDGQRKPVGIVGRTTFTELLGRSSHQALKDNSPGRRPYILTRSANLNTMKYVCSTWSGDNHTSWKTLKGNVHQTINASLSLYHSYGSDIGGFAGPSPDKELLLRWCQINAYHMRFSIHSYKPISTTAWMYPEVLPMIRNVIKRRYELIPYLYSLHHEGRLTAAPPVAWLAWGEFASDRALMQQDQLESADFWLGAGRLLIAGVYEPGLTARKVYLPQQGPEDEEVYFELFGSYKTHIAGSTIEVETPLDTLPVFARAGAVLPIGKPFATVTSDLSRTTNDGTEIKLRPGYIEIDDWRGVEIFPPTSSDKHYVGTWTEDDGEASWPCPTSTVRIEYWSAGEEVQVQATWLEHDFTPFWTTLHILLPVGDSRKVSHSIAQSEHRDGRTLWEVKLQ